MIDMIHWTNEQRRLGDLVPWPRNPRQIREPQAKRLVESFGEFGQVETLAIGPDNEIYNGHQRLNALRAEHGADYMVDVRVSSRPLTEREREKLTVYLHKGAAGEWDFDVLANEFDLGDLLEWGFEPIELGIDTTDPPEPGDAEPQVNRAEELREEWGVEPGQMWRLPSRTEGQEHRLICGDCTDAVVVERLLNGEKPLLMVTDPPYGVEYDPAWRVDAGIQEQSFNSGKVTNDDKADWREAWAMFPGDVIYTWHAGVFSSTVQGAIESCGFVIRAQIIWNKDLAVFGRGDYHWKHEPCWYAVRKGRPGGRNDDRKQTTVWDIPTIHSFVNGHNAEEWELTGHGTQKPLECMARPIRNHEGDVYDPFVGSGTTIIAAENLARQCRAIEISPAYVAVALQRYQDAFGIAPELIDNLTV